MFFYRVGTDAELLGDFPIGEMFVVAQPQDGASRFRQASGYRFRFLQQCFVFPIVAFYIGQRCFVKGFRIVTFHLQMLHPVEAGVADCCINPASAVGLVQLVEVFPSLLHHFAYDVPCFLSVAHQL